MAYCLLKPQLRENFFRDGLEGGLDYRSAAPGEKTCLLEREEKPGLCLSITAPPSSAPVHIDQAHNASKPGESKYDCSSFFFSFLFFSFLFLKLYILTHMQLYIFTCIHTYKYTYKHIYIHSYIYILSLPNFGDVDSPWKFCLCTIS